MSSKDTTIAFFGATGGCALAVLAATIEAGYNAKALVRTPQKLTDLLSKRGIKEDITQSKLVIIQGNAKDKEAVTETLVDDSGKVVDKIIFGIGGIPTFTPNPLKPGLDDPVVCQSSMSTILSSLSSLFSTAAHQSQPRPLLTAISTTGMSAKRDIPLLMIPLYHWMLGTAHADKKVMEEQVEKAKMEGVIREYVIVKPSLLVGEQRLGREKIRAGWEGNDTNGEEVFEPAIGYTISREDVGGFIFEEVVGKHNEEYFGKKVSITY